MPRTVCALTLLVPTLALAEPASFALEKAPAALAPAVARGEAALAAYGQALQARLMGAMKEGGPTVAVSVCHDEAPALTADVAKAQGLTLGRTSDRLRNPANAPPGWTLAALKNAAGKKASAVAAQGFDLGDRIGVVRPIAVKPACLGCHGQAASLSPKVKASLEQGYPKDQATGYTEGDFRGFFWAEVKK